MVTLALSRLTRGTYADRSVAVRPVVGAQHVGLNIARRRQLIGIELPTGFHRPALPVLLPSGSWTAHVPRLARAPTPRPNTSLIESRLEEPPALCVRVRVLVTTPLPRTPRFSQNPFAGGTPAGHIVSEQHPAPIRDRVSRTESRQFTFPFLDHGAHRPANGITLSATGDVGCRSPCRAYWSACSLMCRL